MKADGLNKSYLMFKKPNQMQRFFFFKCQICLKVSKGIAQVVDCEDVFKHSAAGDAYAAELVQETAKCPYMRA